MQPSSAAAECPGYSLLYFQSSFNDQQEHALVDDLQVNVMTQYNKRWLTSSMGIDDPTEQVLILVSENLKRCFGRMEKETLIVTFCC